MSCPIVPGEVVVGIYDNNRSLQRGSHIGTVHGQEIKKSGCTQAGEKMSIVGSILFFSSLVFQSLYSRELEAVKSTRPCPRVLQSGVVSWGELRRKVSDTERERGINPTIIVLG